jgi:hypothetical protein
MIIIYIISFHFQENELTLLLKNTVFWDVAMEAIRFSETSVNARSTRTQRHIPEDGILYSHGCENISYIIIVIIKMT